MALSAELKLPNRQKKELDKMAGRLCKYQVVRGRGPAVQGTHLKDSWQRGRCGGGLRFS